MRTTNLPARAAAALLAAEALGLFVLAAWQVLVLLHGDTGSVPSSVALIVLTVVGAAVVVGLAIATARLSHWGRSGGIVIQLLTLAIGIGVATDQYVVPVLGWGMTILGLAGLVLLILAVRDATRQERRREHGDGDTAD